MVKGWKRWMCLDVCDSVCAQVSVGGSSEKKRDVSASREIGGPRHNEHTLRKVEYRVWSAVVT